MPTGSREWLDTAAMAAAFGISERAARAAMRRAAVKGQPWRGAALQLRRVQTGRGGRGCGWAYEVRADSLPGAGKPLPHDTHLLREHAAASLPAVMPAPARPARYSPDEPNLGARRYELIAPALRLPFNSPERKRAIEAAALAGGVSTVTIRRWIDGYEAKGIAGLKPDWKSGRYSRKVAISRRWDAFAGDALDTAARERVEAALEHYVKRLWRSNAEMSWSTAARFAGRKLEALTREAGYAGDPGALKAACRLTRRFVERDRLEYQWAAVHEQDAKRWHDNAPRIRRTRQGRDPMEIVFGDVHPVDILLPRADGSTFTAKLVAFLDWANNRIFAWPVFPAKGEGVRQEHVVEALIAMTQAPGWGVPQTLYLDNGKEYGCLDMAADAFRLAGLTTRLLSLDEAPRENGEPIRRAQPYNAAAKPIEGVFKVLERGYFTMLPGWIGGDRMAKKTANVGRAPAPYPHGEAAFRRDIANAIAAYHDAPQSGDLDGLSPREAFSRAEEAGWSRLDIDPHALRAAFARPDSREVRQGGFSYGGRRWTAPEIQALPAGATLALRIPIGSAPLAAIPVLDARGELLCMAEPDRPFDALDADGARESARRKATARSGVRAKLGEAPALDMRAELAGLAADAAPEPEPDSAGVIRWNDGLAEAGRELARTPAERRAEQEDNDRISRERWREAADRLLGRTGTDG